MVDSDDSVESISNIGSNFLNALKESGIRRKTIPEELIQELPSQEYDYMLYGNEPIGQRPPVLLQHRTDMSYQLYRLKVAKLHFSGLKDVKRICELLNAHGDPFEVKVDILRSMHQNLSLKRQVLNALEEEERLSDVSPPDIKANIFDTLSHIKKYIGLSIYFDLSLSHPPINRSLNIFFGSDIVSFFSLCWNFFWINLFNFIIVFIFLVIPQLFYNKSLYQKSSQFSLENIFNGKGWFMDSTFYNAGYTNNTIGMYYSVPRAYILIIFIIYALNFIVLIYGMLPSHGRMKIGKSQKYSFSNELFSYWNYSTGTQVIADFMKIDFCERIRELLYNEYNLKRKHLLSKIKNVMAFIFINIIVFIIAISISYIVLNLLRVNNLYYSYSSVTSALLIGLAIIYFYFLKFVETYNFGLTEKTHLYISIIGLLLLRVVLMTMAFYFWLKMFENTPNLCYQTEISSLIYRLTIGNFFVQLIICTFIAEYLRHKTTNRFQVFWGKAHFDLAYHIVDVLHYQFLGWVGLLWVPLIPLLNSFVLFLLFFIKSNSILQNCKPMKVIWSPDEVKKFFQLLTFNTFLISVVLSGYSLLEVKFSVCGPFKDYEAKMHLLESIFIWKLLPTSPNYTWNHSLLFIVTIGMCVAVTFFRSHAHSLIVQAERCEQDLNLIIEDKTFLLQGLDNILNGGKEAESTTDVLELKIKCEI